MAGDQMKKSLSVLIVTLSPAAFAINFASVLSPRDFESIKSASTPKMAQVPVKARRNTRSNREVRTMETISTDMSSGIPTRKFFKNTSPGYYQQFLGPALSGPSTQTYNVYQEFRPGTTAVGGEFALNF